MRQDPFPTTRWSLVDRFGQTGGESHLEEFLKRYRPALLAFLRSHPAGAAGRAEDLVQGFIADKILQDRLLREADAGRGRLRSFLMRSLRNYALNVRRAEAAERRAPRLGVVSLEDLGPGGVAGESAAVDQFEVEWARTVLADAVQRMREECQRGGREAVWVVFDERVLKPLLGGGPVPSYAELMQRHQFGSPAEASNRLITAKRMFSRHLRSIISEYVTHPAEIDEEISDLSRALGARPGAGSAD